MISVTLNQREIFFDSRISVDLPFILPVLQRLYIDQMINEGEELSRSSAFRLLEGAAEKTIVGEAQLGVTNEMMQVISAQNILIMKLLQRQNILEKQLRKKLASSDSGSGNDRPQHPPSPDQNIEQLSSSSQQSKPIQMQTSLVVYPKPIKIARQEEYHSAEQAEQEQMSDYREEKGDRPRQSETKNMIKNFAKAIFGFIAKHHNARTNVLKAEGLDEAEFMAEIERCRGRVHSIAELRGLWTRGGSFGRAFRILSWVFLRRHSLQRTFNSRVENFSVHLKYRHRLLEGVKRPEEFTVLKTD